MSSEDGNCTIVWVSLNWSNMKLKWSVSTNIWLQHFVHNLGIMFSSILFKFFWVGVGVIIESMNDWCWWFHLWWGQFSPNRGFVVDMMLHKLKVKFICLIHIYWLSGKINSINIYKSLDMITANNKLEIQSNNSFLIFQFIFTKLWLWFIIISCHL